MTITLFARPLWMNKYVHLLILLTAYCCGLWMYYQQAFGGSDGGIKWNENIIMLILQILNASFHTITI